MLIVKNRKFYMWYKRFTINIRERSQGSNFQERDLHIYIYIQIKLE